MLTIVPGLLRYCACCGLYPVVQRPKARLCPACFMRAFWALMDEVPDD
jgi:hypothetical protein